jgi:hypothetical protein
MVSSGKERPWGFASWRLNAGLFADIVLKVGEPIGKRR